MANAIDLLSLDEAKQWVSLSDSRVGHEERLEAWVTGVSLALDEYSGPIVIRTVTDEIIYPDNSYDGLLLSQWPIVAISSVTEYVSGTGTVLTAEDFDTEGDYLLNRGILRRRYAWGPYAWQGPVKVTYTAGRFADTASVEANYKDAAGMALQRLWSQYAPAWARGGDAFAAEGEGFSYFRVIAPVAADMGLPRRPSGVAA